MPSTENQRAESQTPQASTCTADVVHMRIAGDFFTECGESIAHVSAHVGNVTPERVTCDVCLARLQAQRIAYAADAKLEAARARQRELNGLTDIALRALTALDEQIHEAKRIGAEEGPIDALIALREQAFRITERMVDGPPPTPGEGEERCSNCEEIIEEGMLCSDTGHYAPTGADATMWQMLEEQRA